MFKSFASVLLTLLLPVVAAAQVVAPAAPEARYPLVQQLLSPGYLPLGTAASTGQAIPLWASPDGRLLALVSLSSDDGGPLMPRQPFSGNAADWQIIDATSLVGGGLRWQLAGGLAATASLSQSRTAGLCAVAGSICANNSLATSSLVSSDLGINWTAPDASSSFNYGVTWLRGNSAFQPFATDATATLLPYRLDQGSSLFANGQIVIGNDTRINLAASHGSLQLLPFAFGGQAAGALDLDQSTLGFGISHGNLTGTIVGRVIDSAGSVLPGQRWTLLDIGLSWRTPWQGQLSVGTRSYLAPKNETPKSDVDIAPSRVPYVQYRQDL